MDMDMDTDMNTDADINNDKDTDTVVDIWTISETRKKAPTHRHS